jgi:site-specific recombinase XerD
MDGLAAYLEYAHRTHGKIYHISEEHYIRQLKRYAAYAGLRNPESITPHRLRAYFASDARDKGVDALVLKDLMRHADLRTTQLYTGRTSPGRLRQSVNMLSEKTQQPAE